MRAIGYVRVSTDRQELGPEAQRAALERWAAAHGRALVEVHEDRLSGATPVADRPGLLAALGTLAKGDVLVVARRDRLARDTSVAAVAEGIARRAGATIETADGISGADTPEAYLMRGMLDLFAAYERALIATRTRVALRVKRERGERTGSVPYGSRLSADGRTLEPDAAEQAALERIAELRAAGVSIRGIADALTAEGAPCRGAKWHRTTVARLLPKGAS